MNLEEIKQYLEQNKDDEQVAEFVEGLQVDKTVDVQRIEQLAQEDEAIKSWLDSQKDKHAGKSLETWKQNNLEKIVAEKLKEMNPEQTPDQIELQQIKQQLAEMEKEKTREALRNVALTQATKKNIPANIVDFLLGVDEATTTQNLETFEQAMKDYINKQVKERISDSSYEPPTDDKGGKAFTKEQVQAMSTEEINKNWNAIKDII